MHHRGFITGNGSPDDCPVRCLTDGYHDAQASGGRLIDYHDRS